MTSVHEFYWNLLAAKLIRFVGQMKKFKKEFSNVKFYLLIEDLTQVKKL